MATGVILIVACREGMEPRQKRTSAPALTRRRQPTRWLLYEDTFSMGFLHVQVIRPLRLQP